MTVLIVNLNLRLLKLSDYLSDTAPINEFQKRYKDWVDTAMDAIRNSFGKTLTNFNLVYAGAYDLLATNNEGMAVQVDVAYLPTNTELSILELQKNALAHPFDIVVMFIEILKRLNEGWLPASRKADPDFLLDIDYFHQLPTPFIQKTMVATVKSEELILSSPDFSMYHRKKKTPSEISVVPVLEHMRNSFELIHHKINSISRKINSGPTTMERRLDV